MPELPEVEWYRKEMLKHLKGKVLKEVIILDGYVVKLPDAALKKFVSGKKIKAIERIGKYLFWELDDKSGLMIHFGLAGKPAYCKNKQDCPTSSRVLFLIEGEIFAFVDPRKFGKIDVDESLRTLKERYAPGTDVLEVSRKEFIEALKGRNTPLKAALLDQSRFSGIGNWLADEILFQSRLPPSIRLTALKEKEMGSVYDNMQKVLKVAIEKDADWDAFPDWFFVKNRKKEGHCPRDGKKLKISKVAGRTTYYCPVCQKGG